MSERHIITASVRYERLFGQLVWSSKWQRARLATGHTLSTSYLEYISAIVSTDPAASNEQKPQKSHPHDRARKSWCKWPIKILIISASWREDLRREISLESKKIVQLSKVLVLAFWNVQRIGRISWAHEAMTSRNDKMGSNILRQSCKAWYERRQVA